MSEQKFSFSGSYQKTKEYLDTQIELLKLKAIARGTRIIGGLVVDATKLLLTLIIIFFFSLALGFYLGELLGSYSLGFLATGGIFLIILLIIRAFEPKLEAKFMDLSIRKILVKWNQEDEVLESMDEESGSYGEQETSETVLNDEAKGDEKKNP